MAGRRFLPGHDRDYGQDLPTPGYDAMSLDHVGQTTADRRAMRRPIIRSSRACSYKFKQYAAFGEATWHFTEQWALTGGLRYYNFDEDRVLTFAGFFAAPPGGCAGLDRFGRSFAAR